MRSRREIGWDLKKHNENTAKLQVRKFRRRPVYQDYRRFSMQMDMESAPTIFYSNIFNSGKEIYTKIDRSC